MAETSNNPFGGVIYEVNADSSEINNLFYDFAKIRYEELNNKNLLTHTQKNKLKAFLDDEYKNKSLFRIPVKGKNLICGFSVRNTSDNSSAVLVRLSVCYSMDLELNLLDKIMYDNHLEHSYTAWHSFETDVLDKLELDYKKDWGYLLRNWYARWFFKNQLYIIGIAIIFYVIYSQVQKKKKRKLDSPEFVE